MKKSKNLLFKTLLLTCIGVAIIGCDPEDGIDGRDGIDGVDGSDGADGVNGEDGKDLIASEIMFENKSNLAPLVAMMPQFNYVEAYSLISSSDTLSNDFKLVGAQDGAGFLREPESDGYICSKL